MHLLSILYSIYIILCSLYYYFILFCFLLSLLDICGLTVVSTFTRATLYTRPRVVRRNTRPLASALQRVQYWSKARRKSLEKPLFSTCNVMYLMLHSGRARPAYTFSKNGAGGGGQADPPRVPSKKFYNNIVSSCYCHNSMIRWN